MRTAKRLAPQSTDPVEYWDELLRPLVKKSPELAKRFLSDVRDARLTFGNRVHCPFLRPVFLSPQDEQRVRNVAETIAAIAERLTIVALEDQSLFEQFHLRPEEERLVRLTTGYGPASTAMLSFYPNRSSLPSTTENRPRGQGIPRRCRTFSANYGSCRISRSDLRSIAIR